MGLRERPGSLDLHMFTPVKDVLDERVLPIGEQVSPGQQTPSRLVEGRPSGLGNARRRLRRGGLPGTDPSPRWPRAVEYLRS